MKIANASLLSGTPLREVALEIVDAGLCAIDTRLAITSRTCIEGDDFVVDSIRFPLPKGKLLVLGAGKCSADALLALSEVLGDRLTAGFVIDVIERPAPLRCMIVKGDHPYPSEMNVAHTRQLLALLSNLSPDDAVIFIVSGGGTVLLAQPPSGFSATDEAMLVKLLFKGGATIHEMNTVRKHLSRARGGFLAEKAYPARSLALVFSDVPGNDINFISSGPTVRDTTTLSDARRLIEQFGNGSPEATRASSALLETPKDEKFFANAQTILFVSNRIALDAMAKVATARGFAPTIVTDDLCGIARTVGERIALDIGSAKEKTCLLYGGETTVRIVGTGTGGRNRELALGALATLTPGCLVTAVASDGIDNGPRAGALVDSSVAQKAKELSMSPQAYLSNNDSHSFFESVGTSLSTGPTGSNVADLVCALKS
jgi:glycerate-2-kinase